MTDSAIQVRRYDASQRDAWDKFVKAAKNGTFLFQRDYMDYHADRFADHSLVFLKSGERIGVMPANERKDALYSHGGLTCGGIVTDARMKTVTMLSLFEALMDYLRGQRIGQLVYKAVPHIYHTMPAEEDLYALFRTNARLVRRDVSACVTASDRVPLNKGRKWSINRLAKQSVEVRESHDFETYIAILGDNLQEKHGVAPTHTAAEIALLAGRFPDNIKLYAAYRQDEMLGGVIMYVSPRVAHVQYIASTPQGREIGVVDGVINHLLTGTYAASPYFDFGISTEDQGRYLNTGLAAFKEGFGARAVVYDTYVLETGLAS